MIKVENLCKHFESPLGRRTIFENLSFSVSRGEFVGLVGKSGSGKSTILSILAGLQRADSGSIFMDISSHVISESIEWCENTCAVPIHHLSDTDLCYFRNKNIGFVSQEQSLLENFTVLDNVRLPAFLGKVSVSPAEVTQKALSLLKSLGIESLESAYPKSLSGGECQRVLIARALINDPKVILADEPTSSLDFENTQAIIKIFRTLADSGKSIILASHDTQALSLCDWNIRVD